MKLTIIFEKEPNNAKGRGQNGTTERRDKKQGDFDEAEWLSGNCHPRETKLVVDLPKIPRSSKLSECHYHYVNKVMTVDNKLSSR